MLNSSVLTGAVDACTRFCWKHATIYNTHRNKTEVGDAEGQQQVIWRGWLIAAGSVVKQPQPGRLVSGAMLVNPAAWQAGLEQGWPQQLVSI